MSQNWKKSTKVNSRETKKSTKVNSRENLPNIETNLPQVVKMRKEAPKSKFSRLKVLKTERFRENNLQKRLKSAYKVQIWKRKWFGRQEEKISHLWEWFRIEWMRIYIENEAKDKIAPHFVQVAGRPPFLAGRPFAFWKVAGSHLAGHVPHMLT